MSAPEAPGSGGGAIRIQASGILTNNGSISASSTDAYVHAGGGSGGGIYITCAAVAGSGGGGFNANDYRFTGRSGGLIRVFANETITMNGILSANGSFAAAGGGGAGGGIYLRCRAFSGATNAILRANGANGNPNNGGGGGGRIAVWRIYDSYRGSYTATGGTGYSTGGTNGTIVLVDIPAPGTIFTIH